MQANAFELYQMYKTYAEKLNQELQALKRFRHDLKKQYFLERMYLETGQYELLKKEYERNGALSFMQAIQGGSSGNMVIDALIANARERAEDAGVEFNSVIRVPVDLKIQDVHMNRLLGNILENALEATLVAVNASGETDHASGLNDLNDLNYSGELNNLDDSKHLSMDKSKYEKWIELIIHYDRGNLYIRCKNSCYHELNPDFRTSKKEKKEHGLGFSIIKEIASLYDGNVEIVYEEKIFMIQVLLYHVDRSV